MRPTSRPWRTATPEQQKRLLDEFKTLLVRTYSGALSQYRDQAIDVKPLITDRFAFADAVAAFEFAAHLPPTSVKVQIELPA